MMFKTMKTRCARASRRPRRAVALIEFALVVPIIIAILMGILEMGWLVKNQLSLSNATRDAARYAALGNTASTTRTRLKNAVAEMNPKITDGQIILEQTPDTTSATPTYYAWPADVSGKNNVTVGNLIRVRVAYPNRSLTGFFPFLNNRVINLNVAMLREAG